MSDIDEHICGGNFSHPLYLYSGSLFGGLLFMLFLKILKKYKISILIYVLTFFLIGYFITDYFYNENYSYYVYQFKTESLSIDKFIDKEEYKKVFSYIDEQNKLSETDSTIKKISYAKIDYEKMLEKSTIRKTEEGLELSVQKKYFPSIASSKSGANKGENRVKNYFTLVFSHLDPSIEVQSVQLRYYKNPFSIGGIVAGSSFLFLGLVIGILIWFNKIEMKEEIEDNHTVFKSVFHLGYWKESISFMKNVKNLCTISILFSFMLLCKLIPIPSGFGNLGIGFTYLFFATICLIYGPICGLFIGFCSDVIGYFIHPSNVFFLGYTLDAMLSGFIYGLCFYKKRITFANCFIARFFVNIFINVGLGSLWWKILYKLNFEAYLAYMGLTSFPKNVLYLLPQSILLFLVIKALSKPLTSFGLIDQKISENIGLF